jgi:DNA-binding protein HU-beta
MYNKHRCSSSLAIKILAFKGVKKMNKAELVRAVAKEAGLKNKEAEAAITAFTNVVEKALKKGDKVTLVGFGTFEVRERAGRVGRNPQTGAEIKIGPSKSPAFKAGKAFKDAI